MSENKPPRWLDWAREIQSISQIGYQYAENDFQRQRNRRLSEIAAEIIHEYSHLEYEKIKDAFYAQVGYATPHVGVRGAVFKDGKLLLVRERSDGCWTMPGGWADIGDLPSEAVEREVWEETGFSVQACRLIGVYDANRIGPLEVFHAYKLVFLCEIKSGEARPSDETSQVEFFGSDELPDPLSGERTKPRHIQDVFNAFANQDSPVVFD